MDQEPPPHTMTTTEARQGQTVNMARWVLLFGLLLVVPGLALTWYLMRY